MYNHDFHHVRAYRVRRLIAWICLAFSLLIIMGVLVYSFQSGIIPGFGTGHAPFTGMPGSNQVANGSCPITATAGSSSHEINSDGLKRNFIVHLPSGSDQQMLPLVINYHGYDSTAANFEHYTNMDATADQAKFIVVYPQGALDNAAPQPKPSWNAGIGANGPTGQADDVQFTLDMLDYLQKNYCIDSHRIYVTGYSIGASMAYRIACAASDRITAFATVEGAFYHIPSGGCQATRPLPVLVIHSLVDQFAPYNGDSGRDLISVPDFLNLWFRIDQCNTGNSQTIFRQADVTGYKWPRCDGGSVMEHYKITDGGHVWPGSPVNMPSLGYTTHTIDANTLIWNFFQAFKS